MYTGSVNGLDFVNLLDGKKKKKIVEENFIKLGFFSFFRKI